ncbi:MAG: hypothetical protein CVV64_14865 [Candidatus Wallbacteria bacterium HGW-Wallbacteria-1]|uniref:Transglutaminase-like domain-containing protein n=1 Tax=Candidatus Wallbacteria bacterium HGW-Wallbacteria-1 TaxID=2013854 RepID=A0A2N1PLX9_9BACT|nr:MAG: hypothetical protein CVV64_14865 [Candidatus Wallbacteria bacterium HGW-Wallbacteria-1]
MDLWNPVMADSFKGESHKSEFSGSEQPKDTVSPVRKVKPVWPESVPPRHFLLSLSNIPIGSITILHSREHNKWITRKRFSLMDPFRGLQVSMTTLKSKLDLTPLSYRIDRFSDGKFTSGELGRVDGAGGMVLVYRTSGSSGTAGFEDGAAVFSGSEPTLVPGGASIHQAPLPWFFDDLLNVALMALDPADGETKVVRVFDIGMKGVYPVVTHYFDKFHKNGNLLRRVSRSDLSGQMSPLILAEDHIPFEVKASGFDLRISNLAEVNKLESTTFDPSQRIEVVSAPSGKLRGRRADWIISLQGVSAEALIDPSPYQNIVVDEAGNKILQIDIPSPTGATSHPIDQDMARWVAPTEYAQSNDPSIRLAAKKAIKGKRSFARRVGKVIKWVDERVHFSEGINFASALESLRRGAGDCTEKAVLAVAMLRALKIPARAVYGLTYHDGGMNHHMWIEVHNGKAWIPGDPTSREWPAGPGHIRLSLVPLNSRDYSMIAKLLMTKVGNLGIEYRKAEGRKGRVGGR